jgi:hypothetical protein
MPPFPRVRIHRAAAVVAAVALCAGAIGSRAQTPPARRGIFCPGTDVELEPNDTPATATLLNAFAHISRGIGGGISPAGDVDYYRVPAQAGDRLWVSVDSGRSSGTPPFSRDAVLDVFAPGGTTLLERDDDDGTANGGDLTIESQDAAIVAGLLLPAGGDYLVRVSAKSPAARIAPYTLLIARTQGSQPEQEPNDDPAHAMFFPNGAIDASLSSASDVDYYRLDLLDGGFPFIAVDGDPERNGTGTDTIVEWVDYFSPSPSPPALLTVDSSGATGSPSPPAEGALVNSTYPQMVRVKGPAAGTYRMGVMWSGYCPVPVVLEKIEIE